MARKCKVGYKELKNKCIRTAPKFIDDTCLHLVTLLKIGFIIATIFTLSDLIFHLVIPYLHIDSHAEPQFLLNIFNSPIFWYSAGKFMATLAIFVLGIYFLREKSWSNFLESLLLTFITVSLLELRYIFIYYYTASWLSIVLVMHFALLFITSYFVLKYYRGVCKS